MSICDNGGKVTAQSTRSIDGRELCTHVRCPVIISPSTTDVADKFVFDVFNLKSGEGWGVISPLVDQSFQEKNSTILIG
jgi:hypothetical protein